MQLPTLVEFNYPLSTTQKVFSCLDNHQILVKACRTKEDSQLRTAYIAAFQLLALSSCAFGFKRPFTPLLGETYEFVTQNVRAVSEQVRAAPATTAYFVESSLYEIEGNLSITAVFHITGVNIVLSGPETIYLKEHQEHFDITRPSGNVNNIYFGTTFFSFASNLVVTNRETGD